MSRAIIRTSTSRNEKLYNERAVHRWPNILVNIYVVYVTAEVFALRIGELASEPATTAERQIIVKSVTDVCV